MAVSNGNAGKAGDVSFLGNLEGGNIESGFNDELLIAFLVAVVIIERCLF
jgi:hypothetical protein